MRVVRVVSGAHGFNIGMNQGSVAGAGIADHLHQHAVPRWGGDTNFMPVVGLTRVLPQVLSETRQLLAARWPAAPDRVATLGLLLSSGAIPLASARATADLEVCLATAPGATTARRRSSGLVRAAHACGTRTLVKGVGA